MKTKQPVSLEEITEQLQIYRIRQFLGYLSGIICFIWTIVFLSHHPEFLNTDVVTPGMNLLEYKRSIALDHMYGARYHQAIDALNEVLSLEPDDLVALKRLGSAYYSLGLHKKAREAWTRALRLAPNDPQLKKFLARLSARHPDAAN